MFKKDIEKRLFDIFGLDRIIFDAFNLGKEQEALFVDIDNIKDYVQAGKMCFIVDGRIAICAISEKHKYGWVHGRIELADFKVKAPFIFGRDESQIKFSHNNNDYTKYEVPFTYMYSCEFNKIKDFIESAEINLEGV